jgi:hypothetical protein
LTYPKEGTFAWLDSYCNRQGCADREAAHKCANQALDVEAQAGVPARRRIKAIVVPDAIAKLQPETKALYPYDNLSSSRRRRSSSRCRRSSPWQARPATGLQGGVSEVQAASM